ncbi:MAG: response regulator [Acetobacteraceae bacterium]
MTHPTASPDKTPRSLILIVDDEPEILVALSDLLEGEFDIISTTSPHDALTLVRDHPEIAVIISDQRMPGMTGDVFLSQVQDKTDAKSILLTGYADLSVVITALNQGRIQFYVHKPWDSDGLKAVVRESASRFHTEKPLFKERFLLQSTLKCRRLRYRVFRRGRPRDPTQ